MEYDHVRADVLHEPETTRSASAQRVYCTAEIGKLLCPCVLEGCLRVVLLHGSIGVQHADQVDQGNAEDERHAHGLDCSNDNQSKPEEVTHEALHSCVHDFEHSHSRQ